MCEQTSDAEGHNAGRAVCGFTNGTPIDAKKPDSSRSILNRDSRKAANPPKGAGTIIDWRFYLPEPILAWIHLSR